MAGASFQEKSEKGAYLMAERRMFAKSVVESARFLKMPVSSQNLYFHLGMNADDTFGVRFLFLQMIGMIERMQKSGGSPGQSIAINIWMQSIRLIIVVINGRE